MPGPALDELVAPGRTALLIQELQNGVVGRESSFPALAAAAAKVGVIINSARLATSARSAGVPVVHATAENLPDGFGINTNARLFVAARAAGADNATGTPSVMPVDQVFADGDIVLPRYHGLSPMTGGPLDALLRNAGVTTLVIAGVSLNVAITNVVFDAVNRSYQVVVVRDAVAGVPVEYGEQIVNTTLAALATVVTVDELNGAWATTAGLPPRTSGDR